MTVCIVSLYHDYKAGNKRVCRTVSTIQRKVKKLLKAILYGLGYVVLTAPFAFMFVYLWATM
jgi:hypothetical protein